MAPDHIAEIALIEVSRWQRTAIAALGAGFLIAAIPAAAAELPAGATQERVGAVMIEWTISNCGMTGISALHGMMAAMVLSGAPAEEIEPIRAFFRQGVKDNYPDKAAACADLKPRIAPTAQN